MRDQHLFEFYISRRDNGLFGAVGPIEPLDASAELPKRTAVYLLRRVAYCSTGSVESGKLDWGVDVVCG